MQSIGFLPSLAWALGVEGLICKEYCIWGYDQGPAESQGRTEEPVCGALSWELQIWEMGGEGASPGLPSLQAARTGS